MTDPGQTQPFQRAQPERKPERRGWLWVGIAALFGLTVVLVGALTGYASGLERREARQLAEESANLQEQFDLGVADLLEGRYELARQRFAYVVSIDPEYPGAREFLGDALEALDAPTATSTPSATPTMDITPSATVDLGSFDQLIVAASEAAARKDYDAAMELLVMLIAEAPDYRRAEVNQLIYSTLRNRGLDKILRGEQEQGIYDLNLAERVSALDSQAESWRRSAAYYLFANSYFGLDWALSTQYFAELCGAGVWDACFKYARSAWEYGDQLFKDDDPCGAVPQYEASLLTREDANRAPTATEAFDVCLTATAQTPTPTATLDLTTTATPTGTLLGATSTPTATFTGTAGATATFSVSATPTFTATLTAVASPTPTPTATSTAIPTATDPTP